MDKIDIFANNWVGRQRQANDVILKRCQIF